MTTRTRRLSVLRPLALTALLAWETGLLSAQTYSFTGGSALVERCPTCGRPDIFYRLQGTFSLTLEEETPIEKRFAVKAMRFVTSGGLHRGEGEGTFTIRLTGPLELHHWDLTVTITSEGAEDTRAVFKERDPGWDRPLPNIRDDLEQTNGTDELQFLFTIEASPFTALWFATRSGFTPGPDPAPERVSGGNLLSDSGEIILTNARLLRNFAVKSRERDPGLDAIHVLPGGRVFFSVEEDIELESGEILHHGDLLADDGTVFRGYAELLSAFVLQPPVPNLGLDAMQLLDSGTVLFSLSQSGFSEKLGVMLERGSLLSDKGEIVRTPNSLLQAFHPVQGDADPGLDAFWVWPHGEVWFSLEQGFQDEMLGGIGGGDLLSDQGFVVYRNLDLLQPFAPLEDLADFGLDAVFLLTETAIPATPRFVLVQPAGDSIHLEWEGDGMAFQLERALALPGPFEPVTPRSPLGSHLDEGVLKLAPRAFYRVRQW